MQKSSLDKRPWIQNVSMFQVIKGFHYFEPHRTVLIQIQDAEWKTFVTPKYEFKNVLQLHFDDAESVSDGTVISTTQANQIAEVLQQAFKAKDNVVVHCHAGLCRSGAVAECGVMLGFEDTEMERIPNQLVKKLVRKALNLTQSWEE